MVNGSQYQDQYEQLQKHTYKGIQVKHALTPPFIIHIITSSHPSYQPVSASFPAGHLHRGIGPVQEPVLQRLGHMLIADQGTPV